MSRFACRVLAENTSALGSRPDSIELTVLLPAPLGSPLLQARPPAMLKDLLSHLFQVAKPLTLPEMSRSQLPARKPIPACAAPVPITVQAAATQTPSLFSLKFRNICKFSHSFSKEAGTFLYGYRSSC